MANKKDTNVVFLDESGTAHIVDGPLYRQDALALAKAYNTTVQDNPEVVYTIRPTA